MTETGRIRIGNQTAFSAWVVTDPFEYALDHGFDAFEWFPDKKDSGAGWGEGDLSEELRARLKQTARAHDLRISFHAPVSFTTPYGENPESCRKPVQLANDLGAVLFNIHLDLQRGFSSYLAGIGPLLDRLADSGLALSIENSPQTGPEDFNQLFKLFSDYGTSDRNVVGMCFDLGHANLFDRTRNDYLAYLDALDPSVPIIHFHLHENFGDFDSHLPLFSGPSRFEPSGIVGLVERLKKRNYSGSLILEQWPHPPSLLDVARGKLLELFTERPSD
jgi:sugar phosphate isomerase/epimerase